MTSTNMGLLQVNMSWALTQKGVNYHWLLELFRHLNLPIFEGVAEACRKENAKFLRVAAERKSQAAKDKRVKHKKSRALEALERVKQTAKRKSLTGKAIVHDYGGQNDITEPAVRDAAGPGGARRPCKCGSYTHSRVNHRDCPLNKKGAANSRANNTSSAHEEAKQADPVEGSYHSGAETDFSTGNGSVACYSGD